MYDEEGIGNCSTAGWQTLLISHCYNTRTTYAEVALLTHLTAPVWHNSFFTQIQLQKQSLQNYAVLLHYERCHFRQEDVIITDTISIISAAACLLTELSTSSHYHSHATEMQSTNWQLYFAHYILYGHIINVTTELN